MTEDTLRYDTMVENALKGVVREALMVAATTGLPGDHHFYITFLTKAPGVIVAKRVLANYPHEMTIVLQHQFWDLEVDEIGFGVTLSFSGKPERLDIPFSAVVGFADPSASFVLRFQVEDDEDEDDVEDADKPVEAEAKPAAGAKVVALDAFRKK